MAKTTAKATGATTGGGATSKTRHGATEFSRLATPADVGRHVYVVIYVPSEECEKYNLDDQVEIYISEPPPEYVTIQNGGACRGTVLMLDE